MIPLKNPRTGVILYENGLCHSGFLYALTESYFRWPDFFEPPFLLCFSLGAKISDMQSLIHSESCRSLIGWDGLHSFKTGGGLKESSPVFRAESDLVDFAAFISWK